MASVAPEGWHSVTPRIFAKDPGGLVAFLRDVFAARGEFDGDRPAEMWIGDSVIMVSSDAARGAFAAAFYVYLPDVDGVFARAVAAGANVIEEPLDTPYGDRRATFED